MGTRKGEGPYHNNRDKEPGRVVSDSGDGMGRGSWSESPRSGGSYDSTLDSRNQPHDGLTGPLSRK